jgi:NAD(P)-dependent dehydrogenase (short-subunit alcohol dehydrogenase family)
VPDDRRLERRGAPVLVGAGDETGERVQGLDGKVAIVTGSGSGIGRASALRLATEGVRVVVADINPEGAAETVERITALGGTACPQEADVSDEASVAAMVAAAVDRYGSLQLLHNNAADVVIIQRDADVVTMDVDVWDRTMTVNLRGPMLGCKHALPHMLAAGGGAIVTTSSTSGQFGDLSRVAYGVSKAGIDSLTRYVATLYGKQGIRCNAVAPGVVKTPSLTANVPADQIALFERNHLTPDMGEPENIAEVVAFLLSDGAAYITGQVVNVDGGLTCHTPLYSNFVA